MFQTELQTDLIRMFQLGTVIEGMLLIEEIDFQCSF